jgi:hypothetical protein
VLFTKIIGKIKSKRMRRAGHVVDMGVIRNAMGFLQKARRDGTTRRT